MHLSIKLQTKKIQYDSFGTSLTAARFVFFACNLNCGETADAKNNFVLCVSNFR